MNTMSNIPQADQQLSSLTIGELAEACDHLVEQCGTVQRRFVRWQGEGVWQAMWAALRASMDAEERAHWADLFFDLLHPSLARFEI